jgi:hypothetical protein
MSHHQIQRLDGDQAERCDGNLPFANRLTALLSTTGHWAGQAFVEGEIPVIVGNSIRQASGVESGDALG